MMVRPRLRIASRALPVLIAAAVFVAVFAGCTDSAADATVRYDISGAVTNLDPQFARGADARMIISSVFEGLMRYGGDGRLEPGVIEYYAVSDDARRYTFSLKEGLKWSNGDDLTAHDFVFAFSRLFDPLSPSPYAEDFMAIAGARLILGGALSLEHLGVRAINDRMLEFRLDEPEPYFLELLATTAAMPCNRAFFEAAHGRYGMEPRSLIFNGPFTIRTWDNSRYIRLRKNAGYHDPESVLPGYVDLYIGRGSAAEALFTGRSDAARISFSDLGKAASLGLDVVEMEHGVWVILYNQADPVLQNEYIRKAFSFSVDRAALGENSESRLKAAYQLMPPSVTLTERPYRDAAGDLFNPQVGAVTGLEFLEQGLLELGLARVPGLQMLVPADAEIMRIAGLLQEQWRDALSVEVGVSLAERTNMEGRLLAGDYQIAIYAIEPDAPFPKSVLRLFDSASAKNLTGYIGENYDALLRSALAAQNQGQSVSYYRGAEQSLIDEAVVTPLFYEKIYFSVAKGVSGIRFSPFPEQISFKSASA